MFDTLKGKTLKSITGKVGDEKIIFEVSDNEKYIMYHDQGCCESVLVEDIAGDFEDIIGSPILLAEVVSNANVNPRGVNIPEYQDSFTWTFYKLSTNKGSVTIRWYGESNGYYGEEVSFGKLDS